MISNDMIELLECAIKHDCASKKSNRCAVCELGFKYIVIDPIQLTCGHTICSECKNEQKVEKVNCQKHGESSIGLESEATKHLLKINIKELFESLKTKYEASVKLLEETKINFDSQLKTTINDLKDNIDLKVDKYKSELEEIRESLHSKLDESEKQIYSEIGTFNVNIGADFDDLKKYMNEQKNFEMNGFSKFQKRLKEHIDEIQGYLDSSYTLQLKESDIDFKNLGLIGSIIFETKNVEAQAKWHESLNVASAALLKINCPLMLNIEELSYAKLAANEYRCEFEIKNVDSKPIALKFFSKKISFKFTPNKKILNPNEKIIIKSLLDDTKDASKIKVMIKYKVLDESESAFTIDEIDQKIFQTDILCQKIKLNGKVV